MKTIGLIGGTGWISSAEYYRIINEEMNRRLGGLTFARCILYSLNFGELEAFKEKGNRQSIFSLLEDAADKLILSGADCILLCANTMHQFADELESKFDVPLIHIARATAKEIRNRGFDKVGLLGTRQTMEMDFYKTKLKEAGIEALVPDADDRNFIDDSIFNELLKGIFRDETKSRYKEIMKKLKDDGAQGIILGCTEIPLLIKQGDSALHLFNTLEIHAHAAVDFAIE